MSVIPALRYADCDAALDFLCGALGFEERVVYRDDDGVVKHAQLVFGKGMIMLSTAREGPYDELLKAPAAIGGFETQSPYIFVGDVEALRAHHDRAAAAGARVVLPLEDQGHGWGYSCHDPQGHLWNFGTYDPWAS